MSKTPFTKSSELARAASIGQKKIWAIEQMGHIKRNKKDEYVQVSELLETLTNSQRMWLYAHENAPIQIDILAQKFGIYPSAIKKRAEERLSNVFEYEMFLNCSPICEWCILESKVKE